MTSVRTADRTLRLFEAFKVEGEPMSLSELAAYMNVPMSSCHGLVNTLIDRGYLYHVAKRKLLYPTGKILDIAETIVSKDPLLDRIRLPLSALRDKLKETIIIGIKERNRVMYIDVIEGTHTVRYTAYPGEFKPLHSSAIGKAILASMTDNDLEILLQRLPLEKITQKTITGKKQLLKDINEGRKQGYYDTHGENVVDVDAVAVSLVLNKDIFGVSVAAPSNRMTQDRIKIAQELLKTKQTILEEFR